MSAPAVSCPDPGSRPADVVVITAVATPEVPDLLGEISQWAARHGEVDDARLHWRDQVVLLRVRIRTTCSPAHVSVDLVQRFAPVLVNWRVQAEHWQRVLLVAGPDPHLLAEVLDVAEAGSLGGDVVAVAGPASSRVAAAARWQSMPFVPVAGDLGRALRQVAELHLVDLVVDLASGLLDDRAVRDALERRGIPVIGLADELDTQRARVRYATGPAESDITTGPAEQAVSLLADVVRAHCAGELVAAAHGGTWWL
jgi:hypothetical protein